MASSAQAPKVVEATPQAPVLTDENVDPNQEPAKYVKLLAEAGIEDEVTKVFLVDVSGSNDTHYKVLVELVKRMPANAIIVPFGQHAASGTQNQLTPASYIEKHSSGSSFRCATYTTYIESVFNYLDTISGPINLFFEGDGDFSDGDKIISIIERAGQPRRDKKPNVIDRIISLTLLFSNHTPDYVIDKLKSQITEICTNAGNMIHIRANKLRHHQILYPETEEIVSVALSTLAPPPGYIIAGDLIIHRDMTAEALSRGLTLEMADQLWDKFKRNAEINPNLLLKNIVYSRVLRALGMPHLLGDTVKSWKDSFLTRKDISEDKKAIFKQMLAQGRTDPNDVKANMRRLSSKIIGYLMFANIPGMEKSILEAMRTMDYAGFVKLVQNALKTASTELVSADMRSSQTIGAGFPILNTMATQEECMQALKSFFCQYGDFNLNGLFLYVCAIGIMTAETQVIPVVYRMVETALFDKLFTTLHFLGFNMETNIWDPDTKTKIINPAICGLFSRFFTQFKVRLFPGIDLTKDSTATTAYNAVLEFARIYTICNFIKQGISTYRVIGTYEFKSTIVHLYQFKVGMVVAPESFKKDPQPNLASLGIIIAINGSIITVEYFDRRLGTNDTVNINIANVISLYDLSRLASVNVNAIIEPFNVWLCTMQVQGARGELGPEMLMQPDAKDRLDDYPVPAQPIIKNPVLYDANMRSAITEIERLMTVNGFDPARYKVGGFYPVDRPITRTELISILRAPGAFTSNMVSFLQTGNNPNAADIDKCKGHDGGQEQIYPAGVSRELVDKIVADFNAYMVVKPFGMLVSGITWICNCCLDTQNAKETIILRCTHSICKTCYEQMISYQPAPGTIINEAMCRCPLCRVVLDDIQDPRLSAIIKRIDNPEMPANSTRADMHVSTSSIIISCRVCRDYYIEHPGCGQDPSTLPTLCPAHRPREEHIKVVDCPHCHAGVTRSSGCDVVTCQCGGKFCFGCGVVLPGNIYDWRCRGSQEECISSADERSYYDTDEEM